MLAGYLRAAIPRPVTILGQKLERFSLGHLYLLMRLDCACVAAGRKIEPGDLLLGVYVCAHRFEELETALERLTPELMIAWGKAIGDFDFDKKCGEFLEYLSEGMLGPELIPGSVQGPKGSSLDGLRTPGTSFLQQVKIFLQHELHMSREAALSTPLGEALHEYWGFYEIRGKCRIKGPDDLEHEDRTPAIVAEIFAEMPHLRELWEKENGPVKAAGSAPKEASDAV